MACQQACDTGLGHKSSELLALYSDQADEKDLSLDCTATWVIGPCPREQQAFRGRGIETMPITFSTKLGLSGAGSEENYSSSAIQRSYDLVFT